MLGISRVDQHDFKSALLEDLVDWDPVDPSGLHGDRAHATSLEPVRQALQITSEGPEAAHRLSIAIRRHRSDVHLGADVDRRCISVGGRDVPFWVGPLRFGHDPSSCTTEELGCARTSTS